jgi:HK97 gp10 family phage protein
MARARKYTKQGFYEAIDELDKRLKKALLRGAWAMRDAARDLAKIGEKEVRASISKTGSYKPYWKDGKKRMSSHPGTPPAASPDGTLEKSIYSKVNSAVKRNPAEAEFGSTAPYAAELEFGTTSVQPRPFLRPAREKVRDAAAERVIDHLVNAYTESFMKSKNTTFRYDLDM